MSTADSKLDAELNFNKNKNLKAKGDKLTDQASGISIAQNDEKTFYEIVMFNIFLRKSFVVFINFLSVEKGR